MHLLLWFSKGLAELDHQIGKFRQLRNEYAEANRPRRVLQPAELPPASINAA